MCNSQYTTWFCFKITLRFQVYDFLRLSGQFVIEEPNLFLVEPMQNALLSYKSVSFEDTKHQFVATCLA